MRSNVGPGRRPTMRVLARQVCSVVVDLPLFVTAPLYRRWHLRWGATSDEAAAVLPGDDRLPSAAYEATRAVTIHAPPEAVWPWLVQVGCLRGGFYSNDLLDNLARPSARELVPDLQHLQVGQWVSMTPRPTQETAFRVEDFDPNQWLLWAKPDSTWVWKLTALPTGGTRLLTRVRARHDWTRPGIGLLSLALMELGDFAMMRRMLLGIKARAEHAAPSRSTEGM